MSNFTLEKREASPPRSKANWLTSMVTILSGLLISLSSVGQTTLISSAGDGGFSSGTTFAANGWTAVDPATANKWATGTAATATTIFGSGRAAYVSTDGGTTAGYNTGVGTTAYFYRDVTFPAGETKITLSYNWVSNAADAGYDFLQVMIAPTSITPVANNNTLGSVTIGSTPLVTGATVLAGHEGQGTMQTASYAISPGLVGNSVSASTVRLIFAWRNDGSVGTSGPWGFDNINLVSAVPGNFSTAASGLWTATATWAGGVVPGAGDNVTINDGHVVTYNTTTSVNNLTIGGGTSGALHYDATARTLTANGNVTINAGGLWSSAHNSAASTITAHVANVAGNLTVNGSINFSAPNFVGSVANATGCTLNLTGASSDFNISGATLANFRTGGVILNKSNVSQVVSAQLPAAVVMTANAASSGTTINVASTTGLTVGMFIGIFSGTGALSTTAVTTVASIVSSTQFTVTTAPGTALASGTVIYASRLAANSFTIGSNATTQAGFLGTGTYVGTFSLDGTSAYTGPIFSTVGYTIGANGAFRLNNANAVVAGLNGSPTLSGLLRVSAGTFNVGSATGNAMTGANTNSNLTIDGGTMNVAGRFSLTSGQVNVSSGNLNICTVSHTNAAASFNFSGTTFNMSGGAINLVGRSGNATPLDFINSGTTQNITGGTLNIGTAASTTGTWRIQGNTPSVVLYNNGTTIVSSVNLSGATNLRGDLTIPAATGATFNTNNFALTVLGNSSSNPGNITVGTGGVFTSNGTASIALSFSSSFGNQIFTNNGTITSNQLSSLTINNTASGGTVTIPNGLTMISGSTLTLTAGQLNVAGAANLSFNNVATTGTFNMVRTNGSINPAVNTGVGAAGILTFTYGNSAASVTTGKELLSNAQLTGSNVSLTLNNSNFPVTLNAPLNISGTLTLTKGILNTSSTNNLVITSTSVGAVATPSVTGGVVNGPLTRTLGTLTGATNLFHFPVSKATVLTSGVIAPAQYNNFVLVDPTTSGVQQITVEVFDANAGGTPGTNMQAGGLNVNKYWSVTNTSPANWTSGRVTVNDYTSGSILAGGATALARSTTLTGTYNIQGGTSPTTVLSNGTTAGSVTTQAPGLTVLDGFYVLGLKEVPMTIGFVTAAQSGAVLSTNLINASNVGTTITVTSTTGLAVGMGVQLVSGTGTLAAGTYVTSIVNATTFQVNAAPTVTLSGATLAAVPSVGENSTNNTIIQVLVQTTGNASPISVTSLDFGNTSDLATDVSAARVYYTGSSTTFATTTQFGADVANPGASFTVSGSQTLVGDAVNYFWLVYDLPTGAIDGNFVDASCSAVVSTAGSNTPAAQTPAGGRIIKNALTGTYTVAATGGNFVSLRSAIALANVFGLKGATRFELSGTPYTETVTAASDLTIGAITGLGAANPLTIGVAAGSTATITGSIAGSIITLNGADYVTIDGSNNSLTNSVCPAVASSRNLTISNTSTSNSSIVWIKNNSTDGANNNTIKNCNLTGAGVANTTNAVQIGAAAIAAPNTTPSAATAANNNNRIENNNIDAVAYALATVGVSIATKNTGTVINQNVFTPASPARRGIYAGFEDGILISGNTIGNLSFGSDNAAINLGFGFTSLSSSSSTVGQEVVNAVVTNNTIQSVINTGGNTAAGIAVSPATSGTTLIADNQINGVISSGTSPDFGAGIILAGGVGSLTRVYNNTVVMQGTTPSTPTVGSTCLAITNTTAPTGLTYDLKNNNFVNKSVVVTGASTINRHTAIMLAYTSTNYALGMQSSNNNLFSAGAGGIHLNGIGQVGGIGSAPFTTLAAWANATGFDLVGVSKNINPVFVSATNSRLTDATLNTILSNAGNITAAGIAGADIDCASRTGNGTIGFQEKVFTACAANPATVTIASSAAGPFCNSLPNAALNITELSTLTGGGYTFNWSDGTTTLGSGPDLAIANLTATTTYTVSVDCPAVSNPVVSAPLTLTINTPTITAAATPLQRCGDGDIALTATSSTGTLAWYTAATGGTSVSTASPYNRAVLLSVGSYTFYVAATAAAPVGCESATRTPVSVSVITSPTITVNNPVINGTPATNPASRSVCSGNAVELSADVTNNANYTIQWARSSAPSVIVATGNPATVNPTAAGTYVAIASDVVSGSLYEGCGTTATSANITVSPKPLGITATPDNLNVCPGGTVNLTGTFNNQPFAERFESAFGSTSMSQTGTGITSIQSTVYYAEGGSSVRVSHAANANGGVVTPTLDLAGLSGVQLSFKHITALEPGYDYMYVEYSGDNGTTWNTLGAGQYLGSGTLQTTGTGTNAFNASSYTDWDTQFDAAGADPGTAPATSLWKTETFNLPLPTSTYRVRFRITGDVSFNYYGMLLDDVKITTTTTPTLVWSSSPAGFSSTALVTSHVPTNDPTSYTLTASNAFSDAYGQCQSSATTAPIGVSVQSLSAALNSTTPTVCAGANVTITAVPTGGCPPFQYNFGSGNQTSASATFNNLTASTTYSVTITDAASQTATATLNVTVNPLPNVTITSTAANVCGTVAANLTGNGASTYTWNVNGGSSVTGLFTDAGATTAYAANAPLTTVYARPASQTTYRVSGTDANGCVNTATQSVAVFNAPTVTVAQEYPFICAGNNNQLTTTVTADLGYSVTTITPSLITPSGASANLLTATLPVDDFTTGDVTMPFTFTYFGTSVNTFRISNNGWLSFSNTTTSEWVPAMPATAVPNNTVAFYWADLYAKTTSSITTFSLGTSPTRIFVVDFVDLAYNSNRTASISGQVHLHEGGTIEIHYGTINNSSNVATLVGIENGGGTTAYLARSLSAVTSGNNAFRFSPVTPTFAYSWAPGSTLSSTTTANPVASPLSTTAYTVTVTETTSGCVGTANPTVTISVDPVAGTASASRSAICLGESVTLTATPTGGCPPYTYAWNLGGGTGQTVTVTPGASGLRNYQCVITDASSNSVSTNFASVAVNDPQITSVTDDTRNCQGVVNLAATATTNPTAASIKWYTAATGGSPLATGPTYAPSIATTTTYYVEASTGVDDSFGRITPASGSSSTFFSDAGVILDATVPATLVSVDVFPTSAGNITIALQSSTGATLATTGSIALTAVNTSGASTFTPVTIPLNFSLPVGTGMRLVATAITANCVREFSASYPAASANGFRVTGGWWTGSTTTNYFFYNLRAKDGCTSATRTAVTGTVIQPPAITLSTSNQICSAEEITVTANSSYSGYSYTFATPLTATAPGANTATVTLPTVATGALSNTDVTYTVNASGIIPPFVGCAQTASLPLSVKARPAVSGVSSSASGVICEGTNVTFNATVVPTMFGATAVQLENFDAATLGWTTFGTGVTAASNATYYSEGTRSSYLTHVSNANGGITSPSTYDFSSYPAGTLITFDHIAALESSYDIGILEYSIDGGTSWVGFAPANYVGSGNLITSISSTVNTNLNNVRGFALNSYTNWSNRFTSSTVDPGAGPATNRWRSESYVIPSAARVAGVRLRFHLSADGSANYWGWLIDNLGLLVPGTPAYSWTTTSSNGGFPSTVLNPTITGVVPADQGTYTFTATQNGCVTSGTTDVSVAGTPTADISATPTQTTFCIGDAVSFAANEAGGANATVATITWIKAPNTLVGTLPTYNVNPTTGAGTYNLTVLNNYGCSATDSYTLTQTEYTITTSITGTPRGTITPSGLFPCGGNAAINITVQPCYQIADLIIDGVSYAPAIGVGGRLGANYTYTFDDLRADHTVELSYEQTEYAIAISNAFATGTGVFVTPALTFVDGLAVTSIGCGDSQAYTFTVNDACDEITQIIVDGAPQLPSNSSVSTYTLNLSGSGSAYSISVISRRKTFTATAEIRTNVSGTYQVSNAGGALSPGGVQTYTCNDVVNWTVVPAPGYIVDGVEIIDASTNTVLSSPSTSGNVVTFTVDRNLFVRAYFSQSPANNLVNSPVSLIVPAYPSCVFTATSLAGCTPSPQLAAFTSSPAGNYQDAWYRFRVPTSSTGVVQITVTAANMNLGIALCTDSGVIIQTENATTSTTAGEKFVTTAALTPGGFYRIGIRNMGTTLAGAFNICVNHIRPITCTNSTTGSLCGTFTTGYTGANTYNYTFTNQNSPFDVQYKTLTSAVGPAGTAVALSSVRGLRYGTTYNVSVEHIYNFVNAANLTTTVTLNSSNVCTLGMVAQPAADLSAADRCPATRTINQVISAQWVCGVVDYEWRVNGSATTTFRGFGDRFMRITSLGILTPGTYNIDIRPYFSDGGTGTYAGTWSTVRQLCVVAPAMPIFGEDQALENAKTLTNGAEVILYPNPTNGEFVNFNIKGINSDNVQVRVIDAMGRSIFNKRYVVDGSLNTVLTFDAPLASGLYMVEYIIDGEVQTQRMVVQK